METSLKPGFAQTFSCCPKNLSCPKLGGGCSPPRPPGPYAYVHRPIFMTSKYVECAVAFANRFVVLNK